VLSRRDNREGVVRAKGWEVRAHCFKGKVGEKSGRSPVWNEDEKERGGAMTRYRKGKALYPPFGDERGRNSVLPRNWGKDESVPHS